jgi:imidazole glycerol-phosphate synthase subunit HisH
MSRIGVIDYGAGNLTSVKNALAFLGLDFIVVRHPEQMHNVSHMILPGVGAFASAMRNLQRHNLVEELREQVLAKKKPFLGICVGMQVLGSRGHEFEECPGLAFIEGAVVRIDNERHGLRIPHMGWNEVNLVQESPLFRGIGAGPIFYFVHSYHLVPTDRNSIVGISRYGDDIVVAVQRENILGVQFHPEKSQQCGLGILRNFASI